MDDCLQSSPFGTQTPDLIRHHVQQHHHQQLLQQQVASGFRPAAGNQLHKPADVQGNHVTSGSCRFTVGADESFPLPPTVHSPLSKPNSYCSDSSGDSGISLNHHHRHLPSSSCPSLNQFKGSPAVHVVSPPAAAYSDRTAEWLIGSSSGGHGSDSGLSVDPSSPFGPSSTTPCTIQVVPQGSTAAADRCSVSRRQHHQSTTKTMNNGVSDSASNSSRSSTASSGSSSSSTGLTGSLNHISASHVYSNNNNNNINNYSGSPAGGSGLSRLNHQHHPHHHVQQQHQTESSMSHRLSYHSTTSSGDSHTSLDCIDCDVTASSNHVDIGDLLRRGCLDTEVLYTWLASIHLEPLYQLFVQAGYDMPTISRMTPEDLTAIGITQPVIRKRLTAEISRLNIGDGLPQFKPTSVSEWLCMLCLDEYQSNLARDGYCSMDSVTEITWEDLEEMGIHKLGHQKKLMLAIDRLKKLDGSCVVRSPCITAGSHTPPISHVMVPAETQSPIRRKPSITSSFSRLHRSPSSEASGAQLSVAPSEVASEIILIRNSPVVMPPELVAIQVNRTWVANDEAHQPPALTYESFRGPATATRVAESWPQERERSTDEISSSGGEKTPTNDSGGTLSADDEVKTKPVVSPSRPRPQIAPKPRLDVRRRRASASEATNDGDGVDESVIGRATLRRTSSRCEEVTAGKGEKPGLGILAAVSSQLPTSRHSSRTIVNAPAVSSANSSNHAPLPAVNGSSGPEMPNFASAVKTVSYRDENVTRDNDDRRTVVRAVSSTEYCSPKNVIQNSKTVSSIQNSRAVEAHCTELSGEALPSAKPILPAVSLAVSDGRSQARGDSPKKPPCVPPKRTNSIKGHVTGSSVLPKAVDNSSTSSQASATDSKSKMCLAPLGGCTSEITPVLMDRSNSCSSAAKIVSATEPWSWHRESSISPGPAESSTLPFANENVGTIRQRSAPSGELADIRLTVGAAALQEEMSPTNNRAICKKPERPIPMKKPQIVMQAGSSAQVANESKASSDAVVSAPSLDTEDVFNDIDSMFQGLAQELDELLTLSS